VPAILHSDQGSEYLSYKHQELCERLEITLSASSKASPWQNGFMERFFGTLKDELPPLNTLKSTEQLHEAVTLTMHYYNHKRRHSALQNMSLAAYAARLQYRCRGCSRYIAREDLNPKIQNQFKRFDKAGIDDLMKALDIVWEQKEGQAAQEANRIRHKIDVLTQNISNQVEAATDPSNATIKENILDSIAKKKAEIADLEEELAKLSRKADNDHERFLRFAFAFIEQMGSRFLEISPENRVRCKLILFPAGFWLDAENKVYTPQISPLYGLAGIKNA
jgi:rubrerythrin